VISFLAIDLLLDLDRLGIQVKVEGDRLRWKPHPAMTADLRARIERHKPALVKLLTQTAASAGAPRNGCRTCPGREFHRVETGPHWLCSRCYPPLTGVAVVERWTVREESKSAERHGASVDVAQVAMDLFSAREVDDVG
jgi:hypothetical protein